MGSLDARSRYDITNALRVISSPSSRTVSVMNWICGHEMLWYLPVAVSICGCVRKLYDFTNVNFFVDASSW